MKAMTLTRCGLGQVESCETETPVPGPTEVQVKVLACGVCRTDLHVVDGELPNPRIPIIPGHEIVGRIETVGAAVTTLVPGTRIGIPWLGWTCGEYLTGRQQASSCFIRISMPTAS